MVLMAIDRASQAEEPSLIAFQALVIGLGVALDCRGLSLKHLILQLGLGGLQVEEIADKVRYFKLLLSREDLCERDDVIEDDFADITALLFDYTEDIEDFLKKKGRDLIIGVNIDLHNLLDQSLMIDLSYQSLYQLI